MPFFIDTSALFKRYQPEKGTDLVCRILEKSGQPLYISSISIIEIISNLKRLFEIDNITDEVTFLSSDSKLCKIAAEEGLSILNLW
jgi:PIN domain nuclease of toxin-antitoxin system